MAEAPQKQDHEDAAVAVNRNPGAVFGAAVDQNMVANQVERALPDPAGDAEEEKDIDELKKRIAVAFARLGCLRSIGDDTFVWIHSISPFPARKTAAALRTAAACIAIVSLLPFGCNR